MWKWIGWCGLATEYSIIMLHLWAPFWTNILHCHLVHNKNTFPPTILKMYTHVHKWLPKINKQNSPTPPTKLQGGVAVKAEFFIAINSLWGICRLLCVSECLLHRFTQCIRHCSHFNQNTVSKRAVCWPYWYERGGGVNIVFFMSGSHFWTCVYNIMK